MSDLRADVLIVGGGPAGCAAGIALAGLGRSVVVVERPESDGHAPPGEILPPSAHRALHRLTTVPGSRDHAPCHGVRSAWGSPRVAAYDFLRLPYGRGWRIDRRALEHDLRARLVESGARLLSAPRLRVLDRPSKGGAGRDRRCGVGTAADAEWRVELLDHARAPAPVDARWVVDASGRARVVARAAGARAHALDRLVAATWVVAPPGGAADAGDPLVESVPDGWWVSSLTPAGRLAVARFTDADLPSFRSGRRGDLDDAPRTAARVRARRLEKPARIWSARSERLDDIAGPGWCAAGDAAAAHDPLCGNGITYGLETGWRAARAVHAALDGDAAALERYAASVRASFDRYLEGRDRWYAAERRWPGAAFWRRRHEGRAGARAGQLPAAASGCASRSNAGSPRRRSQAGSSLSSAGVRDR